MDSTLHILFAALAVTAALAGCTKEITPGKADIDPKAPAAEGSRVIAVSFAPRTKTALGEDGLTPVFEDGDLICVANGIEASQICTVRVDGNDNASFTTSLSGPLKAVYPADAADFDTDGKTIKGFLVSTVQSGTFTDANICMAQMAGANDESLSFENKTAVFRITPMAEDISYLEVSADNFDIANSAPTGSTDSNFKKVCVDVPSTNQPDEYFVSILVPEGLTVGHLSFSDGTNVKTVTGDRASEPVAVNTIYKVTVPNSFAITCEAVTITGASFSVTKENAVVTEASPDDILKVEVTCPYGYIVDGITVCKTGDSSTTVEVGTDGSFTMPAYAVTVKVEFKLDESGGGTKLIPGGLL